MVVTTATPRGFRDVLPEEAWERDAILSRVRECFFAWGYDRVETPVLERYETYRAAAGELEGTAFRLFDLDGRMLALRPDMTVPIARMVSARFAEGPEPLRLYYVADVFREHESLRGQPRQFCQAGVELVGASGAWADAEVVSVMSEALAAAGLADHTIAIGTVAVLRGLLDAADASAKLEAEVFAAAHSANVVAIDGLSARMGAAGAALREVVRVRGGREAIDRCREILEPVGCAAILEQIAAMWDLLSVTGVSDRCLIDFGVMRDFDYYTGLVLEAYAPRLGVPIGGGGRYDDTIGRLGRPRPAAGFAIGLERLLIGLSESGVAIESPSVPSVVGGEPAAAFAKAAARRRAGERVVIDPAVSS
jgi:ATP phosphoribosyltransferase/ATP phosphoribosyltransferase regulatory subunit